MRVTLAAAWWPKYWAQAQILINAQDRDSSQLVGLDRAGVVESYLAQNKKNIEHRVEMLISRARQKRAQYLSGNLPVKILEEWNQASNLVAGLAHHAQWECPACGEMGVLEGENVDSAKPHYEQIGEEDFDAWMDLSISADYFSCMTCQLVLDGYELLEQAEVPIGFGAVGEIGEYMEPDYGND